MEWANKINKLTNFQGEMLDFVIRTAEINSGSYHHQGVKKVAEIVVEAFQSLHCQSEIHTCPDLVIFNDQGRSEHCPMGPIARFWKRPSAPVQVLLVGHMDTVFGVDHAFQQ